MSGKVADEPEVLGIISRMLEGRGADLPGLAATCVLVYWSLPYVWHELDRMAREPWRLLLVGPGGMALDSALDRQGNDWSDLLMATQPWMQAYAGAYGAIHQDLMEWIRIRDNTPPDAEVPPPPPRRPPDLPDIPLPVRLTMAVALGGLLYRHLGDMMVGIGETIPL